MVTQATKNKNADILINLYVDLYKEKYGKSPEMNRYKQRWGFGDMYLDLGIARAREVVEYYFTTENHGHGIGHLLSNYERMSRVMEDLEKDEEVRRQLREETKRMVEERYGNK